jgi:putative oxidoreductase
MSKHPPTNLGRIILFIGRIALAAVFLVAAYAKLKPQGAMPWSAGSVKTSLAMFAMQVDSYQLLPVNAVNFVAHTLPPFELLLGLWLLSGIALYFSSLITTLLLGGFFGVMVRTYTLGLEVSCGCFGPGEQLGAKTLLRDGALLALSLAVCIGAFLIRRKHREAGAPVATIATPQRAD